ncbi:Agroclavine dehydrogenase [Psilocybe cubensis]|uniref:NAD(P)-binding protein n=2 Tax=Psilocybe cubensis TaxID=181762 RepID=A0A8H7XQE5_PSICU|nr:Agroclavine dehydrogenase [Psilocybe cubensis]KAH9478089.1 Agroclavine dehydrogenase [Psilocybe cubensis]
MTTLITGGTGKTGLHLANLLHQAGHPVLIASRSGTAPAPFQSSTVKFDWLNPDTHKNPFTIDANIERVYLVAPNHVYDPLPSMQPFLDLAVSKGVRRFVLLTGSQWHIGELPLGTVHQYLLNLNVEYAVIKPTWFIDNFASLFLASIRDRDEVFSAAGDGRIPFVSAEDIAHAAFEALTAKQSPNKEYFVLGPELYTYEEVAKLFSTVLGREIRYRRLSVEEQTQIFASVMPAEYARKLAGTEQLASQGAEEKLFREGGEKSFIGKQTLLGFIEKNKNIWVKKGDAA